MVSWLMGFGFGVSDLLRSKFLDFMVLWLCVFCVVRFRFEIQSSIGFLRFYGFGGFRVFAF